MRESWPDDRLDDLNGKVDLLRSEMRTEFKAVRSEMRNEFRAVRSEAKGEFAAVRGEMREGFDRVDARFQAIDERLFATHRMMMGFCGLMLAALIGLLATLVIQI